MRPGAVHEFAVWLASGALERYIGGMELKRWQRFESWEPFHGRGADEVGVALFSAYLTQQLAYWSSSAHGQLRTLLDCSVRFDANLGWDGSRAYSGQWSEQPWLEETRNAGQVLLGHRAASPAEGAHGGAAVATLQEKTDALAGVLAALLSACRTFWNSASDGERGRSLYGKDACAKFTEAIGKAQTFLG